MLCISVIFPSYFRPMIFFSRKFLLLLTIPLLTQCGGFRSAPPTQTVTGPFNSRGDYVEDWVDQPDKWYCPPTPDAHTKPKPVIASNTQPLPEPLIPLAETNSPPPVVKPSPTTLKPKIKPPSVVRYTVKRGDTLSTIANRYKISVSKIQSANGLRGSVIRVGQNLKIPR